MFRMLASEFWTAWIRIILDPGWGLPTRLGIRWWCAGVTASTTRDPPRLILEPRLTLHPCIPFAGVRRAGRCHSLIRSFLYLPRISFQRWLAALRWQDKYSTAVCVLP